MKKELFSSVLINNSYLKQLIFNLVNSLSREDGLNISGDMVQSVFKWDEVIFTPHVLAGNGYFNLLKERININLHSLYDRIFTNALRGSGSLELVEFMLNRLLSDENNYYNINDLLAEAIAYNRLDVVNYILDKYSPGDEHIQLDIYRAMATTPISGDLNLLKRLNSMLDSNFVLDPLLTTTVFDRAALVGNIDFIAWLRENRSQDLEHSDMYPRAIKGGHSHVVEYLINSFGLRETSNNGYPHLDLAAELDQFSILKLLYQHGIRMVTESAMNTSASNGNINILCWLNDNTTGWCTVDAMEDAAYHLYIDVVKWLHNNRTEGCSTTAIDRTATRTEPAALEMIKWLLENRSEGCTDLAMFQAGIGGNLETVKFLNENTTVGYTDDLFTYCGRTDSVEIIDYLNNNSNLFDVPQILVDDIDTIFDAESVKTFNWFLDNFQFTKEQLIYLKNEHPRSTKINQIINEKYL
ncbi:hypothetical protein PPL_01420 [Heterostelium album PN500]|uniref:Ankyrin repeat protein n=1 Tax=Heterostelium pallidum (strain ATCC 26659 / Pp 5 / PN500) TaxID=670386 RepID=D3AZ80_HETP5|nr:hypothetical protein PPL_01420 [Heterostelium album PN500]EFA85463.1 hypothetical protein PPL_01420 [Heterostelium album PN500]|eukprot:XP_020437571.1 hypothetical protein PPL_01420 [Heterostelium album PN500]